MKRTKTIKSINLEDPIYQEVIKTHRDEIDYSIKSLQKYIVVYKNEITLLHESLKEKRQMRKLLLNMILEANNDEFHSKFIPLVKEFTVDINEIRKEIKDLAKFQKFQKKQLKYNSVILRNKKYE